jgi:hypothetical protein
VLSLDGAERDQDAPNRRVWQSGDGLPATTLPPFPAGRSRAGKSCHLIRARATPAKSGFFAWWPGSESR